MAFALSAMKLSSSAFGSDGAIPARHTGEGEDISPPLSWTGGPPEARSWVVFCHDPDAPLVTPGRYGFVHWVLYNIPGSVSELAEGTQDYTAGRNDFESTGYGGPMPPEGHGTHRYYFWVLALDDEPGLEAGLDLWEVLERIEPHVIAMNRLVGSYRRE